MTLDELKTIAIDTTILAKHSNNHERRKYIRSIVGKELLADMYINQHMTSLLIKNTLASIGINCDVAFYIGLAKEYGIEPPSYSEAALRSMDRRIATNIANYGKNNPLSKGTVAYEKRNHTVKQKYNVDNVFINAEVKQKIIETNMKKYGVAHPYKGKIMGSMTKPHQKVLEYINGRFVVEVDPRNVFRAYNTYHGRIYSPTPDLYIPEKKLVIEIYGDFFHANPLLYCHTDIIPVRWNKIFRDHNRYPTAGEIWKEDSARIEQINSFGTECLILWESEINADIYKEKIDDLLR